MIIFIIFSYEYIVQNTQDICMNKKVKFELFSVVYIDLWPGFLRFRPLWDGEKLDENT